MQLLQHQRPKLIKIGLTNSVQPEKNNILKRLLPQNRKKSELPTMLNFVYNQLGQKSSHANQKNKIFSVLELKLAFWV
jgi:hypothetical protein